MNEQAFVLKLKGKDFPLPEGTYYLLDNKKAVLKHDFIRKMADKLKVQVDNVQLEFGHYQNKEDFCFVYRATGTNESGLKVSELGEANPSNLKGSISLNFPATMANKRATDRLIIRLLGIQDQVYSDSEIQK